MKFYVVRFRDSNGKFYWFDSEDLNFKTTSLHFAYHYAGLKQARAMGKRLIGMGRSNVVIHKFTSEKVK